MLFCFVFNLSLFFFNLIKIFKKVRRAEKEKGRKFLKIYEL